MICLFSFFNEENKKREEKNSFFYSFLSLLGIDKIKTLLDLREELLESDVEPLLLGLGAGGDVEGEDLLDPLSAELDGRGEEAGGGELGLDEGALDAVLLRAVEGAEEGVGELEGGEGHGEGGGAGAVLGLDDLVTAELDAVGEGGELLLGDGEGAGALGGPGED